MGDNVTLASGSKILTHDGSTKNLVDHSRVGRVEIGNDVFIGANAIVLPNVKIGNRVIVGAGAIVTRNIPDNSVAVGNPARIVGTYDDYVKKTEEQFKTLPVWHTPYKNKTKEEKEEMKQTLLNSGYGFDD
jgi:maltose O-acetyltransferase